jgi:anaerobic ribonucleoside-triphosphate reductase activating protein
MKVRIAGVSKESVVDGPGIRYVIFAQGCRHNCMGCHNPETHDFNGGYEIDADYLIKEIENTRHIDGVTLSGGDPFYQSEAFSYITEKLKEKDINIIAYSGFTYEQIIENSKLEKMLQNIDVLIDGPFILNNRTLSIPFRGSSNQRAIDVNKSKKGNNPVVFEF